MRQEAKNETRYLRLLRALPSSYGDLAFVDHGTVYRLFAQETECMTYIERIKHFFEQVSKAFFADHYH